MDIYKSDLQCKYCETPASSEVVEFRDKDWFCSHCKQWNCTPDDVDKRLCSLAENYIINGYARQGRISYAWEEWEDPDDDLSSYTESSELCPDVDYYSWWKTISVQILGSEINESNDETQEYCVEVNALIAVASGSQDDEIYTDAYENVEPEPYVIYVHFERDEEGDFRVVGTEE